MFLDSGATTFSVFCFLHFTFTNSTLPDEGEDEGEDEGYGESEVDVDEGERKGESNCP